MKACYTTASSSLKPRNSLFYNSYVMPYKSDERKSSKKSKRQFVIDRRYFKAIVESNCFLD